MVSLVKTPYQVFYDEDGKLLENGEIYVGQQNQNAEISQIEVFFDIEQTIPANQPLRTSNGIILNNGSPANLYTDETEYSFLVKNQQGQVVYSTLNRTFEIDAKEVNFTNETIPGGIEQDLGAYLSRSLNFKDFGAKGDGVTDDSGAINAAIANAPAGSFFKFTEGQYALESGISLSTNTGITIEWENTAILVPKQDNFIVISSEGTVPTGYTTLSVDASPIDLTITLTTAIVGANVGDWLEIRSDASIGGTNSRGTRLIIYRKIIGISGTEYTFNYSLNYDFLLSDNAQAGLADIKENYQLINPNINNFDFGNDLFFQGITFTRSANVTILNPNIYGSKPRLADSNLYVARNAIAMESVIDSTIENINLESIGWYGIAYTKASENGIVRGGIGKDMRHVTDVTWETLTNQYAGQPVNIKFIDLTAQSCTESGHSTHENGQNILFQGCTAINSGVITPAFGFFIRNFSCRVIDCFAEYSTLDGLSATDTSAATEVVNFEGNNNGRDGIRINTYGRVRGGIAFNNAESGIGIGGGLIDSTTIVNNNLYGIRHFAYANSANNQLRIRSVDTPFSASQPIFLRMETLSGLEPQQRTFLEGKNIAINYGNSLYSVSNGDFNKIPMTDKQTVTAIGSNTDPISGFIESGDWVAGVVTVTTNVVRAYAGLGTLGAQYHKVHLVEAFGVTAGTGTLTVTITDGVSFTVTSSDAAEARRFYWYLGL